MDEEQTLMTAATILRERADAATPGPWRSCDPTDDGAKYRALVSDTPHPDRTTGGGWGYDAAYGGYLIGESHMSADRTYIATLGPDRGHVLADGLTQHADLHHIYDCQDRPCHLLGLARMITGSES